MEFLFLFASKLTIGDDFDFQTSLSTFFSEVELNMSTATSYLENGNAATFNFDLVRLLHNSFWNALAFVHWDYANGF